MCPDYNIENTNDNYKNYVHDNNIMRNHSNIENINLMTLMFNVKSKNVEPNVLSVIDSGF